MNAPSWAVLVLEDHIRRHSHPCEFCEHRAWKRWKSKGGKHPRKSASPLVIDGMRRYHQYRRNHLGKA